jgi:short-subunit dehydrogenase
MNRGSDTIYTLITGGSMGIGKALAGECARRGRNLLLVALPGPELERTAEEIRSAYDVRVDTLGIDLTLPGSPGKVYEWCEKHAYTVDILMNNAGIAGSAIFEESPVSYSDERILLNIRALVILSRLFIPMLKQHGQAYILNTGSFSAYQPLPYKSVYAASKSFVHLFSLALNEELRDSSVSVTVVNPNGVRTNVGSHGRIATHGKLVQHTLILDAEKIARISVEGMLNGKKVVIPGFWNRSLLFVSRLMPLDFRIRKAARMFRRELFGSA